MIDVQQSDRLAERRLWFGHVQQLFQTLELDGRSATPDITESLAVFCQDYSALILHEALILESD